MERIESNEFVSDEYDIIRGDLFLKIIQNEKPNHFHIELQTLNDATMVIRLFEYGFQSAKQYAKIARKDETLIYIPKQLVIFVEENRNIGNELKKLRHEMERIKRKHGRKQLLQDTVKEAKLIAETIAKETKNLYNQHEITGEDLYKILLAVANLFEFLNDKYGDDKTLEEEVRNMTKTLIDPVVEQRGIEQGIEHEKFEIAQALLSENCTVEFVAKVTKLDQTVVQEIKDKR